MDAPALPELDADAIAFLCELVPDDLVHDVARSDDGASGPRTATPVSTHEAPPLVPHDASMDSPGDVFTNVQLSQATAALEIASLELFPPSDDEHLSVESATLTATATSEALKTTRRKPRRTSQYDPNRARNARRHELIYLREKVADMEHELARLHDTTATYLTLATLPSASATTAIPPEISERQQPLRLTSDIESHVVSVDQQCSASTGVAVWQRIAKRQQSERERAERENKRLKIVLETQLKVAKSLEHVLHKRTTMQGFDEIGLHRQPRVFASVPKESDTEIFNRLLDQVHTCYLLADTHFENFGVSTTEASCRDARIRDAVGGSDVTVEIFVNDVLPFPVHAAGKAAWQHFSHDKNHLPYRFYYKRVNEDVDHSEDTVIENSGMELDVNGTKAVFNSKQVIRRYVETDRVVIAYASMQEAVEFANQSIRGFDYRDWGCMVLKKPTTLDADAFSVLQSCYFITPDFHRDAVVSSAEGNGADQAEIIGELTEFMLNSTADIMGGWLQMIENILVAEQAA